MKKQLRVITYGGDAIFTDLNGTDTWKNVKKYLKLLQAQNDRAFLVFENAPAK